ncbi:uncharacterized protein MYCFIDRAFT_175968 [Pseudocercospora fijiensis CIRAD86]|uniref:Uncharacterized protein n=1 Tax=Pseudocercospora fijiensis (strain CIRAD86) TaxID=383855 RepID=M3ACZ5_PSEFD|nr:uncharacterized protein MYCFIDRAFT_175968 [Pseudocercospora fijiensis CIRAD86]EME82421.1 hypothetical protein MYCFIDRAFT_175968 [Pseudocercospora fijiensis CIRAD86]
MFEKKGASSVRGIMPASTRMNVYTKKESASAIQVLCIFQFMIINSRKEEARSIPASRIPQVPVWMDGWMDCKLSHVIDRPRPARDPDLGVLLSEVGTDGNRSNEVNPCHACRYQASW